MIKHVCSKCSKVTKCLRIGSASNGSIKYKSICGKNLVGTRCPACVLKNQRKLRTKLGNNYTLKYEKTYSGFLMRIYRNMKSRIYGVQWKKKHLYEGKFLLSKESFYEWANNCPSFFELFDDYKLSGFSRKLAPSVNRINSDVGYVLSNMEWVTQSENSRMTKVWLKRNPDRESARIHNND